MDNKSPTKLVAKALTSQQANIDFRKYQDAVKGLTFESITLNGKICEINESIKQRTRDFFLAFFTRC